MKGLGGRSFTLDLDDNLYFSKGKALFSRNLHLRDFNLSQSAY